jgi:hypothetical protein
MRIVHQGTLAVAALTVVTGQNWHQLASTGIKLNRPLIELLHYTREITMGTLAGVGTSHHRHPVRAAQAAVEQALKAASITQPDFVLLFASLGYAPTTLLQAVRQATGNAPLIGCSGQGVIAQGEADESSFSVSVMVIQSDELHFTPHMVQHAAKSFEQVGSELGQQIGTSMVPDPIALLLFTDGLTLNFDRLAQGLQSTLPLMQTLPILGGAAGSDAEMRTTYQFFDDQVLTHGTVVALLSGTAQIAWSTNHGCVPIGTAYEITKAEGNLIYELDHQPVFNVLRQYLSKDEITEWNRTIVSFCFGFPLPGQDELTIRYLPQKDEVAGTVMLQTEVQEGSQIWVMRRDPTAIEQGTAALAQDLQRQLQGHPPKLVLQIDCYGRGKSVFTEPQKQRLLADLQQDIGATAPWIGFYSHGEIAPMTTMAAATAAPQQQNAFHNYTLVLAAIY